MTTNILKPFDFSIPRYGLGYIKQLNSKYSIGVHLGYGDERSMLFKSSEFPRNDYRLLEASLEFYKIFESSRTLSEYISVEIHYLNHSETRIDAFYEPNSETYLQFDKADYERDKYAVNTKFGILARLKNSLGINAFVGMGARIRNNTFENIVNARQPEFIDDEGPYPLDIIAAFDNTYERAGTRLGLNVTFGANIMLQLKKAPD